MTLQMDVGLGFATDQLREICKICIAKQKALVLQEHKTGIRLILGGCEKGIADEGMRWELWGLGENAGECKEEALLTLLKKDTIAERRKVSTFVGEDLLGTGGSWLLTQGFWKITVKEF